MRARKAAIVLTPLAAMVTLAVGLRIGASDAMRAATVYSAPLARGAHALVWQVATVAEDRGIREAIAVPDLVVSARSGKDFAEWRGASNADGIAEARLDLPNVHDGDAVWLEVRGDGRTLAAGAASWAPAWRDVRRAEVARVTRREGAIQLDVAALGGRLPVGFPGSIWVRATDRATGRPLAGVAIDVEPEPGLDVPTTHLVTCASGWAEIVASPMFHITGMALHARGDGAEGFWYGGLPVAGAASHAMIPLQLRAREARRVDVTAAGTRGAIYAEIDDPSGRVAAQVLDAPAAAIDVPPLDPGVYWLVTSSEARGAESLNGGTVARPFVVSGAPRDACDVGAELAASSATGFPRALALDGFAGRRAQNHARRRLGATIGLLALAIGATLEGILLVGSARRGAADVPAAFRRRSPAGSVAVALLAALLGFALLAALVLYRST